MRNAGHGNNYGPPSGGEGAKPHSRRSSSCIMKHSTNIRYFSLLYVSIEHWPRPAIYFFKQVFYMFQNIFVDHELTTKIFAEQWFCDIISSRTKPPGY